jgi:secreted protein with Ig-like and vWFA domain
MIGDDRLALLQEALILVVDEYLDARDRVAIVTYSSDGQVVLPSTQCTPENKPEIIDTIAGLVAEGYTHASEGLDLAYQEAEQYFVPGGVNRVIIGSDGDFNVGITSEEGLINYIRWKAQTGVSLTALGFGLGNLRDNLMEAIADNGNGNYAYIDTLLEARRVLIEEVQSTFEVIASDVKLQVEFNPDLVHAWRLIGYENRVLGDHQFNDDTVDAGEIGAGHTVTALFEIVPAPQKIAREDITCIIDLRYKKPYCTTSRLLTGFAEDSGGTWQSASNDFRFAAGVAAFGMLLRNSQHDGTSTWSLARQLALNGRGEDIYGYRNEFVQLISLASSIFQP